MVDMELLCAWGKLQYIFFVYIYTLYIYLTFKLSLIWVKSDDPDYFNAFEVHEEVNSSR